MSDCKYCNGTGRIRCPRCSGQRYITDTQSTATATMTEMYHATSADCADGSRATAYARNRARTNRAATSY